MEKQAGLLDGIRIIDLTRVLAGPYCTMMLGDLGADVIKIEHPERGDDTRHWGPPFLTNEDGSQGESAYFICANRNKRSLTLNLKEAAGLEILKSLIRQGDVLIENFRSGTLAGWGLDWPAMQKLNPSLIYCTITGYGQTGPYRERAGYDFMIQAAGGFMSVTGPADGEPVRGGVAIADLATGLFAGNAILAALFRRERSGEGQRIDLALLDAQIALMSYAASNYLVSGEPPPRLGNGHKNIVPYEQFRTRDGWLVFGCGNDQQWARFCLAVDHPEWSSDTRFSTNTARVEHRAQVMQRLNALFPERDTAVWLSLCHRIGIPCSQINDLAAVFADPQVQARGMLQHVTHPAAGSIPQVGSPLHIPTQPTTVRRPPPLLGQHSTEILQELLQFDPEKIQALRREGVI